MDKVYSVNEAKDWFLNHSDGSVICVVDEVEYACNTYLLAEEIYKNNGLTIHCPHCDEAMTPTTYRFMSEASGKLVEIRILYCEQCALSLVDLDKSTVGGSLHTNTQENVEEPLTQLVLWLKGGTQKVANEEMSE
jgi:hypothetical protein